MSDSGPTFGAFNQGEVPTIACFNRAKTPLGVDLDALIAAMQVFVDHHVAPVWATPQIAGSPHPGVDAPDAAQFEQFVQAAGTS